MKMSRKWAAEAKVPDPSLGLALLFMGRRTRGDGAAPRRKKFVTSAGIRGISYTRLSRSSNNSSDQRTALFVRNVPFHFSLCFFFFFFFRLFFVAPQDPSLLKHRGGRGRRDIFNPPSIETTVLLQVASRLFLQIFSRDWVRKIGSYKRLIYTRSIRENRRTLSQLRILRSI